MKRIYNCIRLITKTFKRKKCFKNLAIKQNELMSIELFRIIQKWENQISNCNSKKLIYKLQNTFTKFAIIV